MFENIEWLFFGVGSTLVDEHLCYEHTFRDIAELTNLDYKFIYDEAIEYYKQNKKGDIELEIKYNLSNIKWHMEDEILYKDVPYCLDIISKKYRIDIIGNEMQVGKMGDLEIY